MQQGIIAIVFILSNIPVAIFSRRNILKAKVPGVDADKKELKHLRAGILDEGNAYDDYQTNDTEKWDPWNLEDGEIEKQSRFYK